MNYLLNEEKFHQLELVRAQLELLAQLGNNVTSKDLDLGAYAFTCTLSSLNHQMSAVLNTLPTVRG